MSRRRYRPGSTVVAAGDVSDRTGTVLHQPTLTVRAVDRVDCGCVRLRCDRPGAAGDCPTVALHTGRCGRHPREIADGA